MITKKIIIRVGDFQKLDTTYLNLILEYYDTPNPLYFREEKRTYTQVAYKRFLAKITNDLLIYEYNIELSINDDVSYSEAQLKLLDTLRTYLKDIKRTCKKIGL